MTESVLKGHLWVQNKGYVIGLNGYDGTFTCKRCLATRRASRFGQTKPFNFHWQKDSLGRDVPSQSWDECPADE